MYVLMIFSLVGAFFSVFLNQFVDYHRSSNFYHIVLVIVVIAMTCSFIAHFVYWKNQIRKGMYVDQRQREMMYATRAIAMFSHVVFAIIASGMCTSIVIINMSEIYDSTYRWSGYTVVVLLYVCQLYISIHGMIRAKRMSYY